LSGEQDTDMRGFSEGVGAFVGVSLILGFMRGLGGILG
jgi:hypothetical protein